MDLAQLLKVVRRGWRLIVVGVVVFVACGLVLSWLLPSWYSATTIMYVSAQTPADSASAAYQGSLLSSERVASYAELVTTDAVAEGARSELGWSASVSDLKSRVTVQVQADTVLLSETAEGRSPEEALALSNAVASSFIRLVTDLEKPANAQQPPIVTTKIVQPAIAAPGRVFPNTRLFAGVSAILGLALTVGWLVVRAALDRSVRDGDEAVELTGLPMLGSVPRDENLCDLPSAVIDGRQSVAAEAIRQVRANLQYVSVDSASKAIIVTSSIPDEGKSTIAANLAAAISSAGPHVVLVEGDLRKPSLTDQIGLDRSVGLTSVLSGRLELRDAMQTWGRARVAVLASGPLPPNPSELMGSEQMASVIQELRRGFDYMIIDMPPVLPVADASQLAGRVDGVLFVCGLGYVERRQASRAVTALRTIGAPLIGVVANLGEMTESEGVYYYNYAPRSVSASRHGDESDATTQTVPARPSPRRR